MKELDKFSKDIFCKTLNELTPYLGQGEVTTEIDEEVKNFCNSISSSIDYHLLLFALIKAAAAENLTVNELSTRMLRIGLLIGWSSAQTLHEQEELERMVR